MRSRPGPAGTSLRSDVDDVDVFRFERLAERGRALLAAGDPASAAPALREALELWRGPALADAGESQSVRACLVRLEELRLAATEARINADLRLGSPGTAPALVADLEGLLAAHPLRETLAGLLMRALAAAGRRGVALAVYEQVAERLADELGATSRLTWPRCIWRSCGRARSRARRLREDRAGPVRAASPGTVAGF